MPATRCPSAARWPRPCAAWWISRALPARSSPPGAMMLRRFGSAYLRESLRPLAQMIVFVFGSGFVLSAVMVVLALVMRGSAADQALLGRHGTAPLAFTLAHLPQVLIDSVTLGFVYAAIALGYSMVYGVLEFINFAHSEIFATGAFLGTELLIALEASGRLS